MDASPHGRWNVRSAPKRQRGAASQDAPHLGGRAPLPTAAAPPLPALPGDAAGPAPTRARRGKALRRLPCVPRPRGHRADPSRPGSSPARERVRGGGPRPPTCPSDRVADAGSPPPPQAPRAPGSHGRARVPALAASPDSRRLPARVAEGHSPGTRPGTHCPTGESPGPRRRDEAGGPSARVPPLRRAADAARGDTATSRRALARGTVGARFGGSRRPSGAQAQGCAPVCAGADSGRGGRAGPCGRRGRAAGARHGQLGVL